MTSDVLNAASLVLGAFSESLASRYSCSLGVSQELERGDLGKSGKIKYTTAENKMVMISSRM